MKVDDAKLAEWKTWTDAAYLRAMADKQEEMIGEPVKEHTARLRKIADRLESIDRGSEPR